MIRSLRALPATALAVLAGALLAVVAPAAAQETGGSSSTTTAPGSSTTTTTAPPVTVDLGNGDIGVLPPGAGGPAAPPPAGPLPGPDGGDAEVPAELPVVILPDPTPGLNAALAAIDVTRAEQALADAEPGRRATEAALAEAFSTRSDAVAARRDAVERMLAAKRLVDQLAVNAVIYGNVAEIEPVIGAPSLEYLRDRELAAAVGDRLILDLEEARRAHRRAVEAEMRATDRLVRATTISRLVRADYLRLRSELGDARRRAAEARQQSGPTILGSSVLEAADLVAWYRTYYPTDPPMAPVERLVGTYLEVGEEEGVTADIAFAQAVLETAGFRSGHAQKFNFAGIGAFDHCAPECSFSFPDLEAGVRAHIHLLRAYADPELTSAQLAKEPNPIVAPERVGVRGCCERWTELTGVWATDPNYDRKVLGIYRLMVETARSRDRIRA
jgi:hypothetical protein